MLKYIIFFVIVLFPFKLYADGTAVEKEVEEAAQKHPYQDRSAAGFDKRLPPVVPGEEINAGNKKIRVLSTGGSPTGVDKEKCRKYDCYDSGRRIGDLDVIVDHRGNDKDHYKRDHKKRKEDWNNK